MSLPSTIGGPQAGNAYYGPTGSIGGAALAAGASASGSVVIPGASAIMANGGVIVVSPATPGAPGAGFHWVGYMDASTTDQVDVEVTNVSGSIGTPTASEYMVCVFGI